MKKFFIGLVVLLLFLTGVSSKSYAGTKKSKNNKAPQSVESVNRQDDSKEKKKVKRERRHHKKKEADNATQESK